MYIFVLEVSHCFGVSFKNHFSTKLGLRLIVLVSPGWIPVTGRLTIMLIVIRKPDTRVNFIVVAFNIQRDALCIPV